MEFDNSSWAWKTLGVRCQLGNFHACNSEKHMLSVLPTHFITSKRPSIVWYHLLLVIVFHLLHAVLNLFFSCSFRHMRSPFPTVCICISNGYHSFTLKARQTHRRDVIDGLSFHSINFNFPSYSKRMLGDDAPPCWTVIHAPKSGAQFPVSKQHILWIQPSRPSIQRGWSPVTEQSVWV